MPSPLPVLVALSLLAPEASAPPTPPTTPVPASGTAEAPAPDDPPAPVPPPAVPAPEAPLPLPSGRGLAALRRNQVERIVISGLTHTRESVVRRHLLVSEGDPFDPERVLLSRLRLLQLGWFSRVETRVERGSERGLVVLVFEVVERNTLVVTDLVFGSTPPQPFYGGLGLSQQNFLGRGLGLSGAFVYGGSPMGRPADPDRFTVRAGFFAPNVELHGLPRLVAGISGLFLRGEEFACQDPDCDQFSGNFGSAPRTQYQRAGGELTVGLRPGSFERLLTSWRFERVHATAVDTVAGLQGAGPPILPGWSTLSALTATYEVDTRDDFFFPTEGLRGLGQVTFASAVLGGDYEYSRYLLQLETAYSLFGKRLRFQGALGAVQGGAPFFDRFYAADYSYFAVGPALGRALELNFSTYSRYDAILAMGGVEYAVPLWAKGGFFHRGYVALGLRVVYSEARPGGGRTQFSSTPLSADVALRLDTPVGAFNASFGYLVDIFL
jgi:outer membrane protein insertion porin family